MSIKTTIFSLILGLMILGGCVKPVIAQTYAGSCEAFNYNFGYGMRDGSGDNIYRLQTILISQGYLSYGSATGYFGPQTLSAVRRFQLANGIPPTGYVASVTRARLAGLGCVVVDPGIPVVPVVPVTPTYPNYYAPTISSLSPSYGPFGTVVTIYGNNFNRNGGNSINFANVSNIRTGVISNDGTSMQFTIPASPCQQGAYACTQVALAPGQYPISVTTSAGTSNTMMFTVTDYNSYPYPNNNRAPVISGVEGPTYLTTGQSGTWTVRASDPNGGYLNYSVVWGDEGQYNTGGYPASSNSYNQSASFSHTYYTAGTYSLLFTVRNSAGVQTDSRISVQVGGNNGGGTNGYPTIYSVSPQSGYLGTQVTVNGVNFSRYDNAVNFGGISRAYTGIPSYDGRTLTFTPTSNPCTYGQTYCNNGNVYDTDAQVSVTNQYGTSNSLTYRITSGSNQNQTQTLQLNQTGYFDGLRLTPTLISEDSRCPSDVQCIQAGKVVVLAQAVRDNGVSRSISLSSNGEIYTLDDGYKIQITGVSPIKYSNQNITSEQYRITYRVWR